MTLLTIAPWNGETGNPALCRWRRHFRG